MTLDSAEKAVFVAAEFMDHTGWIRIVFKRKGALAVLDTA